jgi:hypothetical protein
MRKLSSLAFSALLAVTAFATPASAQSGSASGSCGYQPASYGATDVNSRQQNQATHQVEALYYEINYSGVPAPTTVGVIIRQQGELESQVAVASWVAQNSGGTERRVLTAGGVSLDSAGFIAGVDPNAQGFTAGGNSVMTNHDNPGGGSNVTSNGVDADRRGSKDGPADGNRGSKPGGSGTQAGLGPGEYVFYIYTGSVGDVYNTKDGTVARNAFIADEKGYLGSFSCGVSSDQGSGPG